MGKDLLSINKSKHKIHRNTIKIKNNRVSKFQLALLGESIGHLMKTFKTVKRIISKW